QARAGAALLQPRPVLLLARAGAVTGLSALRERAAGALELPRARARAGGALSLLARCDGRHLTVVVRASYCRARTINPLGALMRSVLVFSLVVGLLACGGAPRPRITEIETTSESSGALSISTVEMDY